MSVFRRRLELMGGCRWCPSVCQPTRRRGNEGGWDTCLYPECLFNTSRVMKGSSMHARLFGFPPWRSASLYNDRILPQKGWSVFPIGTEAGLGGKIGHRSANNIKIMQMETHISLFKTD